MRADLIVVGAGPAGLAAAAAATAEGLDVIVVDERLAPGGSVNGALGASARDPDAAWLMPPLSADIDAKARLEHLRVAAADATMLSDALAWGLFPSWILAVTRGGSTQRVDGDQVVLATGEYVARPPFPGHELDGVLTPLGLVRALDDGLIAAEAQVAVLGDDWLADAIVAELSSRGVNSVVLLGAQPRLAEVPVHVLDTPLAARGHVRLQAIDFRRADGRATSLDVDWLVVTGPRTVASELAQLAGCEHRFGGYEAGFVPMCGSDGGTSVPGIYVAGALVGASDFDTAERSGTVAGLSAAARAGRMPTGRLCVTVNTSGAAGSLPRPGRIPTIYRAIDPASTATACRCIGTSFAEVAATIRNGASSIDDVKRQAKAGMGPCQGRDCHRNVVRLLDLVGNVDVATLRPMRVRPPVRPVVARALFEGEPAR